MFGTCRVLSVGASSIAAELPLEVSSTGSFSQSRGPDLCGWSHAPPRPPASRADPAGAKLAAAGLTIAGNDVRLRLGDVANLGATHVSGARARSRRAELLPKRQAAARSTARPPAGMPRAYRGSRAEASKRD